MHCKRPEFSDIIQSNLIQASTVQFKMHIAENTKIFLDIRSDRLCRSIAVHGHLSVVFLGGAGEMGSERKNRRSDQYWTLKSSIFV